MSDTEPTTGVDPTTGETVELPSDSFDHGQQSDNQTADPLPGSPA